MSHIHTMTINHDAAEPYFLPFSCECGLTLRAATADEAEFVRMTDGFLPDGPLMWNNGIVIVPLDFSIYSEA